MAAVDFLVSFLGELNHFIITFWKRPILCHSCDTKSV